MKKIAIILMVFISVILPVRQVHAQLAIAEIIKAAVKKVIKAVDLQIQRQQNKVIWLQNAQKVLENAMAKLKLEEIKDWTEKQKELYQTYFNELKKVKDLISYYQRIKEVIRKQELIVKDYRRAWSLVQNDKHFTTKELDYMQKVYSGIIEQSLKNLDEIYMVITSFTTQMSDAKRIEILNNAASKIDQNYTDLRSFNNSNGLLSIQRSKTADEVKQVKLMYEIQ